MQQQDATKSRKLVSFNSIFISRIFSIDTLQYVIDIATREYESIETLQ